MKRIDDFYKMKEEGKQITMLTAYDYSSGQIAEMSEIDIILIGDSLGMVIQGNSTTIDVTLNDVIYHTKAVRKGAPNTYLITDLPYMTYHLDINTTKANAAKIMIETKANSVKIEGGTQSRIDAIKAIIDCEIPVCGHLGLTPQSINIFGEYKVQAKKEKEQDLLIKQALEIEKAGAFMLVLECVPEGLAQKVTQMLKIPTIGIGAGRYTNGQVMVWHDILGLGKLELKFAKRYIDLNHLITEKIKQYNSEVKSKQFPAIENVFYPMTDKNK
jgi:3-methyl-2-oxobutanoate hydroxymethyltransferase